MYANDWRGVWPRYINWSTDPTTFDNGKYSHYVLWQGKGNGGTVQPPSLGWEGVGRTYPYLKDKRVYFCPNDDELQNSFLKYNFDTFEDFSKRSASVTEYLASAKTNVYGSYCIRGWNQPTSSTDFASNKSGTKQTSPLGAPGKTIYTVRNRPLVSCFFMYSPADGTGSAQMSLHPHGLHPILYGDGHVSAVPLPSWVVDQTSPMFGINGTAAQACYWIALDNMP
jgi:hypothetical protein